MVRERRKRIYRKRIPYGMQNFEDVIKEDCYYVDKTPFIEDIEDSNKYFFFIRPRRFGKSLTISMLENYYDINKKDKFDEIFGKLYIGENPTPEHNSYLIIHLNFAIIVGDLNDYKHGMDNYCRTQFNYFADVYSHLLPEGTKEGLNQQEDAVNQLNYLCTQSKKSGQKIYLFIDEYDHFTNQILAHKEHEQRYRTQTHGEGYLRKFFDTIKGAAGDTLARVFVTGVSPVTMDDLTSGFNIGTNYSLAPEFNEMTGFTEDEVRDMLGYYSSVLPFNHSVDELIKVMKPWYDNYCFAEEEYGKTTMYNSVMVLNFLDVRGSNGRIRLRRGCGMQEIHLIGRKVFGLLNRQGLAGIQQPVYSIFQVFFCSCRIILHAQPYKPCQLLYIRGISVCYLTDFTSQLFRNILAGRFESLTDILHTVFLANLIQIEEISKAIEWVTGILEHLFHHVFLASIKAVRYMAL